MEADVLKQFKAMQEQINDMNLRLETYLLSKHEENSEAIDDLTITILSKEEVANV